VQQGVYRVGWVVYIKNMNFLALRPVKIKDVLTDRRINILRLFVLWVILAATILSMSYFYEFGRLRSDSMVYLLLAQNLVDGQGYYLQEKFWARRALGYPTIIAATARITRTDVFWSAKILNALLVGVGLLFLRALFGQQAVIYGLVFLTAGVLNILSVTWSEVPFMVGLIAFVGSLYLFTKTNSWLWAGLLLASSSWLFFMRYAGVFVLLVLSWLGIYYLWRKKYGQLGKLSLVTGLFTLLIAAYLWHNKLATGWLIGQHEIEQTKTGAGLLKQFLQILMGEMNLLLDMYANAWVLFGSLLFLISLAWVVIGRKNKVEVLKNKHKQRWQYFVGVGIAHFLLVLAWFVWLGIVSQRLLVPSSFLIMLGIIDYWWTHRRAEWDQFKKYLLIVTVLAWLINVPMKIVFIRYIEGQITYLENGPGIEQAYSEVRE